MFHSSVFVRKFIYELITPPITAIVKKKRSARQNEKHDAIICWIHLSVSVCIESHPVADHLPSDVKKITEENLD